MRVLVPWLFTCALGLGLLAGGVVAWSPPAAAQFFWSPFFGGGQPAARPKARPKPRPPGDDLPPIVPKQSTAPPPPDDRPYDPKLLRLAEILGAVHYLRELCGAQEGQLWRNQMKELLRYEGSTAVRRAKLVNSFNDGYRGYRRTYRTCTSSATLAVTRFLTEGAQITDGLAKPTHAVATAPAGETEEGKQGDAAAKPPEGGEASKPQAGEAQAAAEAKPADANASAPQEGEAPAPEAKPAEGQASGSQQGATSSPQASAGEAEEAAEPEPKPRRKPRRARRAPPPTPNWFPLINR